MANILLVDDDPILRALASDILTRAGHRVAEASDGLAATRRARAESFDLVITDMLMPGKDGIEVIRDLKESGTKARILAITSGGSFQSTDVLTWARAAGADEVMIKPLDPTRFLETVQRLLETME